MVATQLKQLPCVVTLTIIQDDRSSEKNTIFTLFLRTISKAIIGQPCELDACVERTKEKLYVDQTLLMSISLAVIKPVNPVFRSVTIYGLDIIVRRVCIENAINLRSNYRVLSEDTW